jgi:tetratricopeptide (TPR) repeat protein
MAQKIFISYAREDSTVANRLHDDLRRRGHDVWIDTHSLKGGEDWKLYIRQAIEKSSLVIVLTSSRSVDKRGYFQAEIKHALKVLEEIPPDQVFLIPVRLDNITPKHEELKTLNRVDFFPNYEDGVKRLFASVEHQNAQEADRRALLTAHNARLLAHPFRKGRSKYLLRIGDFRGALETYNHLIDLDPEMYANYVGRAKALYGLGRVPEALKDLDVAEKLNPGHPVVEKSRQEILHGAPLSADTLRAQQVNARNAAN